MAGPSHAYQSRPLPLFACLLALRLVNALCISTFFQPDEYFQSLEPAWQWTFGQASGAWVTWEWREGLRSSLHPLLFAAVYRAALWTARVAHARPQLYSALLIAAPKALQACLAAAIDLFTYRLARRIWPDEKRVSYGALALTVMNPWQWFCSVRTLSNSLETALTIVALNRWPWNWHVNAAFRDPAPTRSRQEADASDKDGNLPLALSLAAIACVLRPTNAIIWATISITLSWQCRDIAKVRTLIGACVFYGSVVLAVSVASDRLFYQRFECPPLRFVYFNVVRSLAVFYGRNRHDYYFTEGFPLLLTTSLPFAAQGIWRALFPSSASTRPLSAASVGTLRALALAVIVAAGVLSLISHKEVRFIYPLLPLLHILAAPALAEFSLPARKWRRWRQGMLIVGVIVNISIAFYVGNVHQRGVVDVVHYIRQEYELRLANDWQVSQAGSIAPSMTVGFMMPCHSTPWRSHLVYPGIHSWALTCEPPLQIRPEDRDYYLDEADIFYADPQVWIEENMLGIAEVGSDKMGGASHGESAPRREWPQYLGFFEQLEPVIRVALGESTYRECWRGFNTHWHDDWRRQGDVIVWCRP